MDRDRKDPRRDATGRPPQLTSTSAVARRWPPMDTREEMPEPEREHILQELRRTEGRIMDQIETLRGDVEQRLSAVERTAPETRRAIEHLTATVGELATDVRRSLSRDASQETRLEQLEALRAGQRAGWSAGAVGSAVMAALLYLLQHLGQQQAPPPPAVPTPRPLATTPLPEE